MRLMDVNENLDPQSLLLLYAADELTLPERRQVEKMLDEQPALRAELHELQSSQQRIGEGLAHLDASAGAVNVDGISRRVGRALRQELARPRARIADAKVTSTRRIWPWVLPTAAAASIVVAAAVWIDQHVGASNQPDNGIAINSTPATEPAPPASEPSPAPADVNFALWLDSFDQDATASSDLAKFRKVDDDVSSTVADSQDPVSQYMLSSGLSHG